MNNHVYAIEVLGNGMSHFPLLSVTGIPYALVNMRSGVSGADGYRVVHLVVGLPFVDMRVSFGLGI